MEDYYAILQIPHNASADDIKQAYRKRAIESHPDKNKGDEKAATIAFQKIGLAWETLGDSHRKAAYDVQWRAQFLQPQPSYTFGRCQFSSDEINIKETSY